jgi:hypothetical protein
MLFVCVGLIGAGGRSRAGQTPRGAVINDDGAPAVRRGPVPVAEPRVPSVEILSYDNGDVSPWAEFFTFDSPDHPKIVQLRAEEKLDDIVRDARSDLDRAVALKSWVVRSLKHGVPSPEVYCDWSAVSVLEKCRKGQGVWCGQAAMVFQQACMSIGLPARFIELGTPQNPSSHFTTEVYLREFEKWAVVDSTHVPSLNVYYTADGVPQSALEMHDRLVGSKLDGVIEVRPERSVPATPEGPAENFYYVRWLTRCDVVTVTPRFHSLEDTFDKRRNTVEWTDGRTIPWEEQKNSVCWIRNERLTAWRTSDPAVVNWKPSDRVRLMLVPGEHDTVLVQLWNADLDFDSYEVSIDGAEWEALPMANAPEIGQPGPDYGRGRDHCSIPATKGTHVFRVRLVRRGGTTGPESIVTFRVP